MKFTQAIVRRPAASCGNGLTTSQLGKPDHAKTLQQFDAYCATLRTLGVEVTELPSLDAFPDSHFVEDVAVVTPEFAVITRPGAPARRGEIESIGAPLGEHRELKPMHDGRLDGGDVMLIGKRFFVGLSGRTDEAGVRAFDEIVSHYGYDVEAVPIGANLHLKSSVNYVGGDTLLVCDVLAEHPAFQAFRRIEIDMADEYACNTLGVNGALLTPAGYPRVQERLDALGVPLHVLDTSEFRKMDGGLTCLSLRF
ncbi:dimethylarginine dimethylaminohydrolase family protein [Burkholderia guangdongensis]|uniref:dimethylarginine dimethylaminohydrolase family protein n=1 Tax=Burkholderia guangdongensis TaxID=1792500 RepID=UPI0015CC9005|nr:amidinotransferase [Burkholderia guangdongensis]